MDVYILLYTHVYYSFVHGEFTLYPSLLRLANVFEKYTVFFSPVGLCIIIIIIITTTADKVFPHKTNPLMSGKN